MGDLRRRSTSTSASATPNSPPSEITDNSHPQEITPTPTALIQPKCKQIILLALVCLSPYIFLLCQYDIESELRGSIIINMVMSIGAFIVTGLMIPVASKYVIKRNMFGFDINKKGSPQGEIKVPEALGLVTGIVYLVVVIVFQFFNFTSDSIWLVEYNAAIGSICFMLFLGFVDDVLDIPWRIKLLLPSIAALPLMMAYAGHTTIVIPKPLYPYLGIKVLDLGCIYKLYMFLLAIFCTNSINIHAGINGLEVGQTIVISSAILIHNLMQIGMSSDAEYKQAHAFSIYLIQPFVGASMGLLSYNWYPSSVFVGDTFTYFAGMTLAVVGILGHFSETLLLFFLPQVLNFLYSCPQLFKIVPCPRHRLPSYDPETQLLTGSKDMNLVNLFLRLFGSCSEPSLCIKLLAFQAVSCAFCFGLRYVMTGWYK